MDELGRDIDGKLKSLLNGGVGNSGAPKCLGTVPDDSELFAFGRENDIPDWVCSDWKYWQLGPKREPLKNWMGSLKWFAKKKMASEPPNLQPQGNASGNGPGLEAQGNASGPKRQTEFDAVMIGLLSKLPYHDISDLLAAGQKNQVLAWLEENAAFGADSCYEWAERLKADLIKGGNRAVITAPKQKLDMLGESVISIGPMVAWRQSPSLRERQNKEQQQTLKEKFSVEDMLTRLHKEAGPRKAYLAKAKKTIERLSKLGAEIVKNWEAANAQAVDLPSGAQIQKVNVFTDAVVGMAGFTNDFLQTLKPDETELLQKFALSMKHQAIALGVLASDGAIDETRLEGVQNTMKAALLELMEKFRELTACILISHGRFVSISAYDVANPVYLSGVDLLKCGGISPINGKRLLGLSIDGKPVTDADVTKLTGWVLSAIWRQPERAKQASEKIVVAGVLASDLPPIGRQRRGPQKISRLGETLERGAELELTLAAGGGKQTEKLGFRPILGDGRKAQFFNVAGNGKRLFEAAKNSKGKTILTRERAKTARAIANRLGGKGIRLTKSKPADFAAMIEREISLATKAAGATGPKFIYMDDWDKLGQYAKSSKKDRIFEAVAKAAECVLGSNRWAFKYAHVFKKTVLDGDRIAIRKTCLAMELLGNGSLPSGAKAVYSLEKSDAKNKFNPKWWCRKFSGFNRIITNRGENFDLFKDSGADGSGLEAQANASGQSFRASDSRECLLARER